MTDEDRIREAQALWAQREADKDFKALSELFAEDGRYVRPEGEAWIGRAMIQKKFEERYAKRSSTFHQTHLFGPMAMRINGASAEATSDYLLCGRESAESPWAIRVVGRVHMGLVRHGDAWLFSEYRIVNPQDWRVTLAAGKIGE
jgi:uncharacterized protein (TIGR02246 family)